MQSRFVVNNRFTAKESLENRLILLHNCSFAEIFWPCFKTSNWCL